MKLMIRTFDEASSRGRVNQRDQTMRKKNMDEAKGCDICGKQGKLLRCAGCKARWYCSKACQSSDWPSHRANCKKSTEVSLSGSAVSSWAPPRQILRIPLSALSQELFAARFQNVSVPVVLTGLFDGEKDVLSMFETSVVLAQHLDQCPLECRVYGAGHVIKQSDWPSKGYVPKVEYVSGLVMAGWIADGSAARNDAYVASCDIAKSSAGLKMSVMLEKVMKATGLKITHFGPSVNLWWGPPGHREGLHVDITDGTLIQLVSFFLVFLFSQQV